MSNMVVVPARRDECRVGAIALHQLETEHAAIEAQRALEIGDLEMDMADSSAGDDGWILRHGSSLCVIARI